MSNAIVSAVLAMVAENRSVNAVLQELLKADGNGPRASTLCRLVYPTGCRIDVPVTCGRRDVRPALVAVCPRGRVRYVLRRHCPSEEARGDSHRRHHKRYTHPTNSLDLRVCRCSCVDRSGWSLCATAVVWTAAEELQKLRAASFVPIREKPVLRRSLAVTPVRRVQVGARWR